MNKLNVFSENDRYLIKENYQNGNDDFLQLFMGDVAFIVPYKYVKDAKDNEKAISDFENDLFDFEKDEVRKYKNAKEEIKTIIYNDRVYVVPFDSRNDKIDEQKIAQDTIEKAVVKYNMIINSHRKLKEKGEDVGECRFSLKDATRYVEKLNKAEEVVFFDRASEMMLEVAGFLGKVGKNGIKKFNTTATKLQKKIKKKIVETEFDAVKKFVTDNYKIGALALAIGVTGIVGLNQSNDKDDNSDEKNESVYIVKDNPNDGKYVTFTGRELNDKHGNIATINSIRKDITILMTAVEGFTDKVYNDGTGVLTSGSGVTYKIDEEGKDIYITQDDKFSEEELITYKWRYIEKNLLPIIATIDRKCSKEELMTILGAGFCWGPNGLKNSQFFKSVKNGENIDQQTRKLTGFRKPIGLLKREYLLACVLNKKWDIEDLKEMPVYQYKDKGYVHCGIYTIDFSDITSCKKNKKGEYIKDKNGHKIPKVDKDGYCSLYIDRADIILNKINYLNLGQNGDYKRVGDLLSEESYDRLAQNISLSDKHKEMLNKDNSQNLFVLSKVLIDRG